jgi:hypothetical protein
MEPSPQISQGIDALAQVVRSAAGGADSPTLGVLLDAFAHGVVSERAHDELALRVLLSALVARRARMSPGSSRRSP